MPKARPLALGYRNRLHFPREYRKFFDRSEVFRFRECVVFRIPNELGYFRLGITLKARGSSLERNRTKRAIRENFRRFAPLLGSHDYNVVISASKKMGHPFPRKLGACIRKELPLALGKPI